MIGKRKVKIISIITILFVISSLISLKSLNVKASSIASKPSFTITDLKATPNPAKVGEDILVSGKINPTDFETTAQQKEIILVLDTSGSMKDEIKTTCTNEKIRYCTRHESSDPNHSEKWLISEHKWVNNYCVEHETNRNHNTTRINELKVAARSFVETMKNVPNLKIAIIKYASDATIVSDLKNANDASLVTSINNLSANGGTNVREGLRKAAFLLNNENNNANKTVVLMTDGNPTYYSTYDKLDNTNPQRYGTGSSTNSDTMTYTKSLAKNQIGTKQYNVYSIGYGLDSNGTKYLKQIHASMKNLPDNTDVIEKDGFFSKSDGSITEIFNQIAENIKNSYELKDVSLDISLNQSFKLNIGGNKVNVGNIIYNKVSDNTSTGKTRYHADPVSFSFLVKGSQVGQLQSILNNININFLFENTNLVEKCSADVKIDIILNELPIITAKLGEYIQEIKKDEEITLTYKIIPEDFVYNNSDNSGKMDIVIVSEYGFKDSNTFTDIKNAIWNKLISKFPNNDKVRYSLILFNNKGESTIFSLKDFLNATDYHGEIQSKISVLENGNDTASNSKAIYEGLEKAHTELSKNSRADASKNLIIISNKDVNYHKNNNKSEYEQLINNIKSANYNIVTLNLEDQNKDSNLYKIHTDLGEDDTTIFYNNRTQNGVNNNIMDLVRDKLVSYSEAKPYEFKPTININIGNNFEPVSGIVRSKESGKENIGIIEVPTIVYNLIGNNNYRAAEKTIEIKLKANNLKPGIYNFGTTSDNKMIYKSIINNNVSVNVLTPTFTVKEEVKNLIHGLYNGIIDKDVNIQENDNKAIEIAQGSTATFGAEFTIGGSSITFDLNIDSNFNTVNTNNIKVYKILNDSSGNNTLTEIARTIESNVDNKFKITINNVKENNQLSDTDILVVYQGRVKEGLGSAQVLKNEIKFSNISKDVIIATPNTTDGSPSLPDLL